MRTIRYDRGKLLRSAAACVVCALCAGVSVVLLVAAPFAVVAAGLILVRALGDREALRFDGEGVRVTGFYGRRTYRWGEVRDIGLRRMTQRFLFGLVSRNTDSIILRVRGGLTGTRKVGVRASLFELGPGGVAAIVDELERARRAGGAERAGHDATSADGFDPDAVMARYLANRRPEPMPVAASAPARPSFGRKRA